MPNSKTKGVFCLEGDWEPNLKSKTSIGPVLELPKTSSYPSAPTSDGMVDGQSMTSYFPDQLPAVIRRAGIEGRERETLGAPCLKYFPGVPVSGQPGGGPR